MKIKPIRDQIVVERDEAEAKSRGGILLPDGAKERPRRGTVLAVGPGRVLDNGQLCPVPVEKGDCVLFTSYAGSEVTVDGETYLVMRGDDVLAVIEE
jgi:chaperonin GroES